MTRRPHKESLYPLPPPVLSRGGRARQNGGGRVGGAVLALVLLLWARPAVAGPAPTGDQYEALEALYDATDGDNWTTDTNWNTTNNNWYGVTTNSDGKVTFIDLYSNNLTGTIPTELEDLTELTGLRLPDNNLSGAIPTELGALTKLRRLDLHINGLSGSIPTELGALTELTGLRLYDNDLSGAIPTELGNLTKLENLYLNDNGLSGSIPTELGALTELTGLLLYDNDLSGSIPTQLGNLTALEELRLNNNNLSGSIPTQVENLTALEELKLENNNLSGSIPTQVENLTALEELRLNNNNLSGAIPAELGDLTALEELYLHNNNLSGAIPAELKALTVLEDLYLYNNAGLSGPIPVAFIPDDTTGLSALEEFHVQNTQVTVPTDTDFQEWIATITLTIGTQTSVARINLDAANTAPVGLWSDETTLWVVDPFALKVFAYGLDNGQRTATRDITLDGANTAAQGLWGDGTTLWVADLFGNKLYAYTLADGSRDADEDIALEATYPRGLWSDGTTLWVVDSLRNVYAYTLADGSRDDTKDFALASADESGRGAWSDGTTLWVADFVDARLYAYTLADGTHDPDSYKIVAPANTAPRGLWSDGTTLWVADHADARIYRYGPRISSDITPPKRIGATNDGETVTLLFDEVLDPNSVPSPAGFTVLKWFNAGDPYLPSDFVAAGYYCLAGNTSMGCPFALKSVQVIGNKVVLTLPNEVRIWAGPRSLIALYAADDAVNQIKDLAGNEAESLRNSGPSTVIANQAPPPPIVLAPRHTNPWGMWGDGETLWVLQQGYGQAMDKLYAYDLADGSWDSAKDIDFPNRPPFLTGLVGDGTTFWVAEADDVLPYLSAYRMDNGNADRPKNFGLAPENGHPRGLAVAGGTLWVGDFEDLALYAYDFATEARQAANDLYLSADNADPTDRYLSADNADPTGLWTNGTTAWVVDFVDKHIYAYDLATKQRHPANDIILNDSNTHPLSMWSDGTRLWVADGRDPEALYEYALPQAPPLAAPEENRAPRAVADEATLVLSPGGSVVIAVLANDSDPDGDPLQIGAVTTPTRGTAAQAGAAILYTPETEFVGTDSFTYTITDGQGATATATVTVTVTRPVSQPPTIPEEPAGPEGTVNTRGGRSGGGTSSGGESQGEAESEPTDGEQAAAVAGYLENPGADSFQSGIGVLSGWVCEAETVTLELDGVAHVAAYGTERGDTEDTCGDTANGFGLLFNWNLLGDGEYEVVALVDGVELDRATVTVTTLGAEFLKDVAGQCEVPDFPSVGEAVTLTWQESGQNFVITDGAAPVGSSNRAGIAGVGYLENPGSNSFQSGIGVLSGWVCAAETVEIEITPESGDIARHVAGYGTERLDTEDACGDTDNGFGLLFNWNLLGDGEHEVVAYVDDVELGRATVRVTTLGEEFLRAAAGECTVEDFPTSGETVTLAWQQNQQNFVITHVE